MTQAIVTKYHGATDRRGSRISATTASGLRIYCEYKDAWNTFDNHKHAANQIASKLDWAGVMYAGGLKDGYVFVFADETERIPVL
jgi:hypothetical protein